MAVALPSALSLMDGAPARSSAGYVMYRVFNITNSVLLSLLSCNQVNQRGLLHLIHALHAIELIGGYDLPKTYQVTNLISSSASRIKTDQVGQERTVCEA